MSNVMPPPPPRNNSGGCWKWGAITCGGCGCLAVIALVVVMVIASRNANFKRFAGFAVKSGVISQNMVKINMALKQYEKDNSRYPNSAEELIPKYLNDPSVFRVGEPPDVTEITYIAPPPGAAPSTVVLRTELTLNVPKAPTVVLEMSLDGQIKSSNQMNPGAAPLGAPAPAPQ